MAQDLTITRSINKTFASGSAANILSKPFSLAGMQAFNVQLFFSGEVGSTVTVYILTSNDSDGDVAASYSIPKPGSYQVERIAGGAYSSSFILVGPGDAVAAANWLQLGITVTVPGAGGRLDRAIFAPVPL